MTYEEAVEYIESAGKFRKKAGLERMQKLCGILKNPEKNIKAIHIAGTNGKGSTAAYISSILMEAGYKTGLYTSPHLERFTERIKINGAEISKDDVARFTEKIKNAQKILGSGGDFTEFEIVTAIAFLYFCENKVDFVVLETGLGGRLDATNVVDPIVSVIMTISYDHMAVLGDTLAKIAFEKAGIIKRGRPLVLYPEVPEALDVITARASEMRSDVHFVSDMKYEIIDDDVNGIEFNLKGARQYKNIKISLLGKHQVMNAATAVCAAETIEGCGYKIGSRAIYDGLKNTVWPGRFEILKREPYYIVLDGGHNIQGISSFTDALGTYFKNKKIKIVCGMLKDKEYKKMAEILSHAADEFITVTPESERALNSEELKDVFKSFGKNSEAFGSIEDGIDFALKDMKDGEVLAFCGSLYMIGKAREIIKNILHEN